MEALIKLIEKYKTPYGEVDIYNQSEEIKAELFAELKKLPQFANTVEFKILSAPTYDINGKVGSVVNLKLQTPEEFADSTKAVKTKMTYEMVDGGKFAPIADIIKPKATMMSNVVTIYTVSLSPTIYKTPENEDTLVSPTQTNFLSFKPQKTITMSFSPESIQDQLTTTTEEELKAKYREKFNKALDMLFRGETNYIEEKAVMIRITNDSYETREVEPSNK